jgi:hypothetical protein
MIFTCSALNTQLCGSCHRGGGGREERKRMLRKLSRRDRSEEEEKNNNSSSSKSKVKFLCLTNEALRHESVWVSGCIDPHFLELGTSWR